MKKTIINSVLCCALLIPTVLMAGGSLTIHSEEKPAEALRLNGKPTTGHEAAKALKRNLGTVYRSVVGTHYRGAGKAFIPRDEQPASPIPANIKQFPASDEVARLHHAMPNSVELAVHFYVGSDALSTYARGIIDELTTGIGVLNDDTILMITGHADSTGGAPMNYRLSYQRANAVADYIKQHRVALNSHIRVVPMGEMEPVFRHNREDKAASRRVQFDLFRSVTLKK